jgi:hypothetical protein
MIHFYVDVDVCDPNNVKWRGLPIKVNTIGVARSVGVMRRAGLSFIPG